MAQQLGTRVKGFREDLGMNQDEFIEWLQGERAHAPFQKRLLSRLESQDFYSPEVVDALEGPLGLSEEDAATYRAEAKARLQSPRRITVALLLPALHHSLFWSSCLSAAVEPEAIPTTEPYYHIVPFCHGESLHECHGNLDRVYRAHLRDLAAVVVVPPAGLPTERGARDAWVGRIEGRLTDFARARHPVPVILLDRHLPGGQRLPGEQGSGPRLSRERRLYPEGVRWIGANDEVMARTAAERIIQTFREEFGEDAPLDRIGIVVEDWRLTPQDRRLAAARAAIEGALGREMHERMVKRARIGEGDLLPGSPNHNGVLTRIKNLLEERPLAVIAGTSHVATLVYSQARIFAEGDRGAVRDPRRRHLIPAILSLDAARDGRLDAAVAHMNYSPSRLMRAVFDTIRDWEWRQYAPGEEIRLETIYPEDTEQLSAALRLIKAELGDDL